MFPRSHTKTAYWLSTSSPGTELLHQLLPGRRLSPRLEGGDAGEIEAVGVDVGVVVDEVVVAAVENTLTEIVHGRTKQVISRGDEVMTRRWLEEAFLQLPEVLIIYLPVYLCSDKYRASMSTTILCSLPSRFGRCGAWQKLLPSPSETLASGLELHQYPPYTSTC